MMIQKKNTFVNTSENNLHNVNIYMLSVISIILSIKVKKLVFYQDFHGFLTIILLHLFPVKYNNLKRLVTESANN